jgi:hypothetical protein
MTVTRQRPEVQANQKFEDIRTRTILNETRRGKTNNGGEVTLTANAATTTLSDPLITKNTGIFLQPTTTNAAGALATTYFDAPTPGSIVIRHANNAQADRTFKYGVFF